MKTISFGKWKESFESLEYLEISRCEKLETISFGDICGCKYLSVVLNNLSSLITIEWDSNCFCGSDRIGRNQYIRKLKDEVNSMIDNRILDTEPPKLKQQRVEPPFQENSENTSLHLKGFRCKAVLNTLVMNSEYDKMNSL